MKDTVLISWLALIIAVASFSFTLYQNRRTLKIDFLKKKNDILDKAISLKKSTQEINILIKNTDDIDPHDEFLNTIDVFCDNFLEKLESIENGKTVDLYKLQLRLSKTIMEFDLFVNQLKESINFRNEIAKLEKTSNKVLN